MNKKLLYLIKLGIHKHCFAIFYFKPFFKTCKEKTTKYAIKLLPNNASFYFLGIVFRRVAVEIFS